MRLGRKLGRSDEMRPVNRKNRAVLKDAIRATVENLESRQLLTAVAINFNTAATDLTGNFNGSNNSLTTTVTASTWSATSGVLDNGGAAGGAVTSAQDITEAYKLGTTPLGDGLVHTISEFVKSTDAATGDKPLQLGFLNGSNEAFNTSALDGYISARILGYSVVQTQTESLGSGAVTTANNSATFVAAANDWLQLTVAVQETNTAAGTFNLTYSVTDFGQSGTATGTVLLAPQVTPLSITVASFGTTATNGNTNGVAGWRDSLSGITVDNLAFDAVVAAPIAPVLNAIPSGPTAVLTWNTVPGAATYTVLRGSTTGSEVALPGGTGITGTTFTDTTVTVGQSYFYTVEAVNPIGTSSQSGEQPFTAAITAAPNAVTGVGTVPSSNQIVVDWAASTSGANFYQVWRASYDPIAHTTGTFAQVSPANSSLTGTTYTDSTAANGSFYSYEVFAVNGIGSSPASAAILAGPSAIISNTITFNDGNVTVSPTEVNNFIVDHDGTLLQPGLNIDTTTLANNENFGYSSTAGVDDGAGGAVGGGLLTLNGSDENLNYTPTAYNLAVARRRHAYRFRSSSEESGAASTGRIAQVGFLNILNSSFNSDNNGGAPVSSTTPAGTTFFGVRPYGDGHLELQSDQLQAGTVNTTVAPVLPGGALLAPGEWYKGQLHHGRNRARIRPVELECIAPGLWHHRDRAFHGSGSLERNLDQRNLWDVDPVCLDRI